MAEKEIGMIKLLKKIKAQEAVLMFLAIGFIVLMVWCDMTMPEYMSAITRLVQTPGSVMKDVWIAGAKMLGFALGSLLCSVAVAFIASRIASGFGATLR